MITIAILEQNAEKALKMKELLVTYSIQKNMDFRTLWFSTEGSVKKVGKIYIRYTYRACFTRK